MVNWALNCLAVGGRKKLQQQFQNWLVKVVLLVVVLGTIFFFLLIDPPLSSMRCESWTMRSRIASAIVFSPITSCHLLTGNCEVIINDAFPCRSSMISIRAALLCASKGVVEHQQALSFDLGDFLDIRGIGLSHFKASEQFRGIRVKYAIPLDAGLMADGRCHIAFADPGAAGDQ